ncbi:crossover junction endodeoxyribonuclease RuvC [Candidatus Falkowbacteria bacterium]|nr:crossover junction endodeoxyribonuclease RuvC [Candidatus Falkowbacteria bacterium]
MLGIDPGIADTGYGVVEKLAGGKIKCLAYGSIKTKAGSKLIDRLEILKNELDELINEYQPGLVAVEELFFCKNAKTALIVGQARGVVLLTVKMNRLKIVEFTPLQIKQAVSAYGQAGKAQVQKMVKILLNLKEIPKPDDAADALAAAICALNYI